MTGAQQREAARQFYYRWKDKGKEDEHARSYWIELLQDIFGVERVTERVEFEKKLVGSDGNTKRIDVYIPETRVLIEQKSLGIPLDKPQVGHDGKTPYEQAKYYDNYLPFDEKARWIITSNFTEIWIYDMNTKVPEQNVVKLRLDELPDKYSMLDFLVSKKVNTITEEMELSLKAGELVGKIHDRFLEQYNDPMAKKTQNSLNILCVRLVFCLYAEDAGLFGPKDAFSKYIGQYEPKDIRTALLQLFKVLDTPEADRPDMYLSDELEAFPYCNGGLFANENIVIPKITQEIKDTLLEAAVFDWSKISPVIFGGVFESTLNPETRRSGGMHYTSVENIHKVIDPLFLDDLKEELAEILKIGVESSKKRKLQAFQDKLSSLKFLDPACGSGNFLTETYISLRRLENTAIAEMQHGQITMGLEGVNPIKVQIDQFYGIEINDFAVTVAKTALWIAESQMMHETESLVMMHLDFLPLKTNAHIVEGNALQMDWWRIVSRNELSYIMGNPPFVGYAYQTAEQKADLQNIYPKAKNLDYVAGWYFKAATYMRGTDCRTAFVSTNSICQGEQVASVWKPLMKEYGIHIDFAYRTFVWDSEANLKAHVHCVIVGFSISPYNKQRFICDKGEYKTVHEINPYLIDAPDVFIETRKSPIGDVPEMVKGSSPVDGGNLLLTDEEKIAIINEEPAAAAVIKKFYGAREYLHNLNRWCVRLEGIDPSTLHKLPQIKARVQATRDFRLQSTKAATRKFADFPSRFMEMRQPTTDYILVPRHSSETRRYIPFGFISPNVICGDANSMIPGASVYHFGIMMSNVHMAWVRAVCGRIKSDYRYSNDVVYNNFPWPEPTEEQRAKIEQTAQGILDARALYPDSSLADLYDPLTMPPELLKAHRANDIAVMKAYGFDVKTMTEADCVAALMKLYQEKVAELEAQKKK